MKRERQVFEPEMFQSTRPRGARHLLGGLPLLHNAFQSTRPRGARLRCRASGDEAALVSIHAPARGATAPS